MRVRGWRCRSRRWGAWGRARITAAFQCVARGDASGKGPREKQPGCETGAGRERAPHGKASVREGVSGAAGSLGEGETDSRPWRLAWGQ